MPSERQLLFSVSDLIENDASLDEIRAVFDLEIYHDVDVNSTFGGKEPGLVKQAILAGRLDVVRYLVEERNTPIILWQNDRMQQDGEPHEFLRLCFEAGPQPNWEMFDTIF